MTELDKTALEKALAEARDLGGLAISADFREGWETAFNTVAEALASTGSKAEADHIAVGKMVEAEPSDEVAAFINAMKLLEDAGWKVLRPGNARNAVIDECIAAVQKAIQLHGMPMGPDKISAALRSLRAGRDE